MRIEPIEWTDPSKVAIAIRGRVAQVSRLPDVEPIRQEVLAEGDDAVLRLTNRHDATATGIESLRVDVGEIKEARERPRSRVARVV